VGIPERFPGQAFRVLLLQPLDLHPKQGLYERLLQLIQRKIPC
jgi:hypothetical protein